MIGIQAVIIAASLLRTPVPPLLVGRWEGQLRQGDLSRWPGGASACFAGREASIPSAKSKLSGHQPGFRFEASSEKLEQHS